MPEVEMNIYSIGSPEKAFNIYSYPSNENTEQYLSTLDSVDWYLPGDFTIRVWFQPLILSGTRILISQDDRSTVRNFSLFTNGNKLSLAYAVGAGIFADIHPTTLVTGNWYNAEAVKSGTTLRLYLNGVGATIGTGVGAGNNISLPLTIGRSSGVSSDFFYGYIDEVIVDKGVARHTSDFTPSEDIFTPDIYTKLYLRLDNDEFIDYSGTGKVVTNNNGVSFSGTEYAVNGYEIPTDPPTFVDPYSAYFGYSWPSPDMSIYSREV